MMRQRRCDSVSGGDERFVLSGTQPQYAPDRTFDTEHIALDADLDIKRKRLRAVCRTQLRSLNDAAQSMVFDAVGFRVESVRLGGRRLRTDYDGRKLTVHLPTPVARGRRLNLQISYQVTAPALGLYFVAPDKYYPRKPVQVWTQGEDEFSRFWFPCHDAPQERTTTELIVRVPRGFTAVSNGRLVRRRQTAGKTEYHWRQDVPHATYLVTLAVGRFAEIRDRCGRLPVLYYCEQGREQDAIRAFGKTPAMIKYFEGLFGTPYPYVKYAQVAAVDFVYGGMENTSATTQTDIVLHDERAHLDYDADFLVSHELVHQWMGDLLTCRDWSHAWLNEGFATYFESLWTRHDKGEDEFRREMQICVDNYFEEDKEEYRRPIVSRRYKQPSDLFDRHLYEKGGLVLYMLHELLGDKDFWRAVRTYVRHNRGRVVETHDLVAAVEEATGRNVRRFFDQWVYGGGHPEYAVKYWWDSVKKEAVLRVVQKQKVDTETGLFHVPVTVAFYSTSGVKRFTETVSKKSQLLRFKLPREPELVLFDPEHVILKKLDFPKPLAMWRRQLTRDPHPQGRCEAAAVLGKRGGAEQAHALSEALLAEKVWWVKGRVAKALAETQAHHIRAVLERAYGTTDSLKAQRLIVEAIGETHNAHASPFLREVFRATPSYFVKNAALKALALIHDPEALRLIRDEFQAESWNDIRRRGALWAHAAGHYPDTVEVLLRYTRLGNSMLVRLTALDALSEIVPGEDRIQRRFIEMAEDSYLRIQIAAVVALGAWGDERALGVLKRLSSGDRDGRLIRAAEVAKTRLEKTLSDKD